MPFNQFGGRELRLARLSRVSDQRHLFIPLDHSVSDGPVVDAAGFNRLVGSLAAGGADGVIVHKGRARCIDPRHLRDCALIVHLSAGTVHAPDRNEKVLVGDVEDAVALGADAVSVHVNVGSPTESGQLADLGRVAAGARRFGLPLLAMIYPRGPRITDPTDAALLAHVVNIAADLGADLVKTSAAAPLERMSEVTASCPVPVLVAGGPQSGEDLLDFARGAIRAGCAGLAVGRRVFSSPDPELLVRSLADAVHGLDELSRPVAELSAVATR
jgi:2-amino-4,5-dihydroxy-6-oxo-7-(phosphonooxy)heptanoate synthase